MSNRKAKVKTWKLLAIMMIACFIMVANNSCKNPYRPIWISIAAVADARDVVDHGLSTAFVKKVHDCVTKHGSKTLAYKMCIESTNEFKAMLQWRTYGIPSVNSAIALAKGTLELAEKVKADTGSTTTKVLSILKESACTIMKVIQEFNGIFPEKAKQALSYLNMIEGLVCSEVQK